MANTKISQYSADTESMLIFASSCIEACARELNVSSEDMYKRMKDVELINDYILKHYDTLHTESRNNDYLYQMSDRYLVDELMMELKP